MENIELIKERIRKLQKGEYLPLYGDLQYKYIFGTTKNIKYTTRLLELLLKKEKGTFENSKIHNEVKLDRYTVNSKSFELDIVVELPDKTILNVEIQSTLEKNAEIKNTMYITKLFSTNLRRGENYKEVKKITQIEFVKENLRHKDNRMINVYHITNDLDINDKILPELFEIIIVNIEKTNNNDYNKNVDEELEKFLKVINADILEEALEFAGENLLLLEVIEKMVRFNNEDYVQDYSRQQALIDSVKETAVEEAEQRGREEGGKQKQLEIAVNLIKNTTMTLEEISNCTNLSIEELEKLKEDFN